MKLRSSRLSLNCSPFALLRCVQKTEPLTPVARTVSLSTSGLTAEQKAEDLATFEKQCRDHYYVEYFRFPYSDYCWVNCWNDTIDPTDVEARNSPSPAGPTCNTSRA